MRLAGVKLPMAATPVPVRVAVGALWIKSPSTLSVPVRAPRTVGLKVTLIVHAVVAASVVPQLFVWEKSPLVCIEEMLSTLLPVLNSVTCLAKLLLFTAWLPKSVEPGISWDELLMPVPVSEMDALDPGKLPVMVSVLLYVPAPGGAKETLKWQEVPGAMVNGQLFTTWNGLPKLQPLIKNDAVEVLTMLTNCTGLVVPAFTWPKSRLNGLNRAVCPVPLRFAVAGTSPAIETDPVRRPVCVGVKLTLTVQLVAAARLAGQLFVCEKSPVTEMEEMATGTSPVFR